MKPGILDLVQPPLGLGLLIDTMPASGLSALPANITQPVISSPLFSYFPAKIRDLLAVLSVEELHMAHDDEAIVYYGKVQVAGDGLVQNAPTYKAPSGHVIEAGDLSFQFRITFPRVGSSSLSTDIDDFFGGLSSAQQADFGDMRTLLDRLGGKGAASIPSDYPTKRFRIELLFNSIIIHLPQSSCKPARLAADGWLEPDPGFDEVTIHLPKIAMSITQNGEAYGNTDVSFDGWGIGSLDDQTELKAGQAIKMIPSLCLNSSGTFGFGLDKIVADFSGDFTPPEIIEKNFGVGDDFKGIWIPQARIFIAPNGLRGMAFDTWGENLLFDIDRGFSGEIGMELVNNNNRVPFEVDIVFYIGEERKSAVEESISLTDISTTRTSHIIADTKSEVQLRIKGGKPPYAIVVKNDGTTITGVPYKGDATRLRYPLDTTADVHEIFVRVEDSFTPSHRFYQETITANCVDVAMNTGRRDNQVQNAKLEQLTGGDKFSIQLVKEPGQVNKDAVLVKTSPDNAAISIGATIIRRQNNGSYSIPVVRDGTKVNFTATWDPVNPGVFTPFSEADPALNNTGENVAILAFEKDHPKTIAEAAQLREAFFRDANTKKRLLDFIKRKGARGFNVHGYASFESTDNNTAGNQQLSERRAAIIKELIVKIATEAGIDTTAFAAAPAVATGEAQAKSHETNNDAAYRIAVAFYDGPVAADTATARVWRDEDKITITPSPTEPAPAPVEPERPSAFRRIGARVRLQRSELVFAELFGEVDVIDETKRTGGLIQNGHPDNGTDTSGIDGAVSTAPGASESPDTPENQGVIDFKISMLFDKATGQLTQALTLGFDKNNARDGFVTINKFTPAALANTMASLLLFAPLIQGGIEAVQSADIGDERTKALQLAGMIGLATTLGLVAIEMEKITLFGAGLTVSESSPDIYLWHAQEVTSIGILLDYAVDFKINFDLFGILTIRTKDEDPATGSRLLPPRARYKAIGFNLVKDPASGKTKYEPIFDTSKGYELSLGDPGALEVTAGGVSLNNLLRILSARLRKENPMVLEVDLALNVNLGVITVENVRVRLTIQDDGKKNFDIIPTKVSINIPGALIGTGYLDFGNSSGSGSVPGTTGGFQGFIDITVVPVKLRIAASVGIKPINENGREATAIFVGLQVELPSAIPLAGTGLGIYGFLGLFAMHYHRKEPPQADGQLPPALKWFYDAPVQGNVINIQGWEPKLDAWSFGLGVILGTMEGGFVLNMKGMFILELPGPRILILVKASLLFPKPPDVKEAGHSESAGILAVVDLDFNIGRLTIGLIIEYNIESVLSLRIPVVSQFSLHEAKDWFMDIGSNIMPAEALILGIVRGYAYIMVHGNGIPNWPVPGQPPKLPSGFSLAFGLGASLIFGDKSSGLYLEVGGDLAAGISFSPLHFYGLLRLRGQLHLWIVSISAHADLEVEGPSPHTYIHGEACGSVDFFFFSVEGCVSIEINNPLTLQPPPDLLTSLTLVSRSSALMAGQGVDRPIDGALGTAALLSDSPAENKLLSVPIDSIPVLNMFATPDVNGCTSFTDTIAPSSTYTQDGWVSTSAKNAVRYRLTSLQLNNTLLEPARPKPVRFWKKPTDKLGDDESSVDMAMLCWMPDPTPRAVQRSKDLEKTITNRWEIVCKQVAPATTVFYTFNQKPLGYNAAGWDINGIAWPDVPGTIRSKPADTNLFVYETRFADDLPAIAEAWLNIRNTIVDHAKVIGPTGITVDTTVGVPARLGRVLQLPFEAAVKPAGQSAADLPEGTMIAIKNFEAENILIDAGEVMAAEILLALFADIIKPQEIIIRTLDGNFKILNEKTAEDYGFTPINLATDLPGHWKDATGPWIQEAGQVMNLLNMLARIKKQSRILVHYKGEKNMRYIQLVTKRAKVSADGPSLLLCAMEMLYAAEFRREEHDTHTQQTDTGTLSDALLGEPLRALLKPNTRYELTVNYEFQRKNEKGLIDSNYVAATPKTFVFKTDAQAPLRLDPWILTSTPHNDMRYHFKDEPVQVYLNDESVIQLFNAYNVVLLAKVLKANGAHPPVADPATMKLDMQNTHVRKVAAAVKTPYQHTLENLVAAGNFPCISDSGTKEQHVVFTIGVELILNTEYSVEIIKEGEVIVPGSNNYRTPLYKLAFRTSRYNSAETFAAAIAATRSKTLLLTASLAGPIATLNDECTDSQLQDVLLTAGLGSVKPVDNISVSVLWSSIPAAGSIVNTLEAILIDTPEPLWRKRPYPDEEKVPSESGEMTHWVMKDKPEMELIEAGATPIVQKIVRTQGGTRTIIYFKPGAAGKQLRLQLKRHSFTHVMSEYGTIGHFRLIDILNITLPVLAPWEQQE
ncbi:MAG: hypothetical protein ABIQ88_06120 [Chitinophagaceae bacterium]